MEIDQNPAPAEHELQEFLNNIQFNLPDDFLDFYKKANGGSIYFSEDFVNLWRLADIEKLNKDYNVDKYAPDFLIFGSDGGDTAYAIGKLTGHIYEMPFIGMSNEESIFKCKTFSEFLSSFGLDNTLNKKDNIL
jgi:hypothetical protein